MLLYAPVVLCGPAGYDVSLIILNRMFMSKLLVTIICVCILTVFAFCNTEGGDVKTIKDVFTRIKEKNDLMTSQKTSKAKVSSGKQNQSVSHNKNSDVSKSLTSFRGIDLYIGNCPFTKDAVSKIRALLKKYKNIDVQYFITKTNSDYQMDPKVLEGTEISLPVDADTFDISEIPAYILNINGVMYKATGSDVSPEEIIESINKGSVKGEKRRNYTDLGVFGKTCKALKVNLTPRELTTEDIATVIEDALKQPYIKADIKDLSTVLPVTDKPVVKDIDISIPNYSGIGTIVVYSSKQSSWAQDIINKSATVGCCIDCVNNIKSSNTQICSKDIIEGFGVKSVPTIINIKER